MCPFPPSLYRLPLGSSVSLETDYNDNLYPPPSATSSSSSSSSSPSLPPSGLPPASSSSFRAAPWTLTAMTSQSLDATTPDFQKRAERPRCRPSPSLRKYSLDFHLRPVAISLTDDTHSNVHSAQSHSTSGYQVPRPASTPQPPPPRRPSSTPSVDSLTQSELHGATPTPPPRPPKPPAIAGQAESHSPGTSLAPTLPHTNSEPERREECVDVGGYLIRSNTFAAAGRMQTSKKSERGTSKM